MDQAPGSGSILRFQAETPRVPVGERDPLTHGGPESPIRSPRVSTERYIPVDRKDIIKHLLMRLFDPAERRDAADVLSYLCALRQARSAELLDELVELYDPFNPDDETVNERELTPDERKEQLRVFEERMVSLIESANFEPIAEGRLKEILKDESGRGFSAEVDLDEYDLQLLYYRGEVLEEILVRDWRKLWLKKKPYPIDSYRRLFLALKLKPWEQRGEEIRKRDGIDREKAEKRVKKLRRHLLEGVLEDKLHLKMFRRIPRVDLRILFPNARIKFKLFDKLWLWVGSGGSTIFAIVTAVLKFVAAVAISLVFIIFTLAAAVSAVVRSVMNFLNTRNRYMMKLAQSLYFHNLASNQSVLALLNDEAEEEDIKEEALAYCFMLKTPGEDRIEDVQAAAEQFLREEFGVSIRFDAADALIRLQEGRLAFKTASGAFDVVSLAEARRVMTNRWNGVPLNREPLLA
jgi:hypothetical protein